MHGLGERVDLQLQWPAMRTQRRGGRRSIYGPKVVPNRSHSLTDLAIRIATAAARRTGATESNIVEHLLRLYGGRITREEMAPLPEDDAASAA
jgi:hypothetical protein